MSADYIVRPDRADGRPAEPYDFARPRLVTDRHLRAAERAHGALGERLGAALSAALGTVVTVRFGELDEVLARDFERSRTLPTALFRLRLAGGAHVGLDLAPALALHLVERHFGSADPLADAGRALSGLERAVVERHWLPLVAAAFGEAWATAPPRPDAFAADPARLPLAPPDDAVVVAEAAVTVDEGAAALTLCYPADALQALLNVPDAAPATPDPAAPHVGGLPLDLRAELGRTRLPVGDLLRLAPGDVIPLGRAVDAPVRVRVGGRLRFEAQAGVCGPRLALHVLTPPVPPDDA
jgi:flagellar motor switch protein FliM